MTKAKTIRKKAEPSEPPVLLFKEKTFEHMGMIATMIGGMVDEIYYYLRYAHKHNPK